MISIRLAYRWHMFNICFVLTIRNPVWVVVWYGAYRMFSICSMYVRYMQSICLDNTMVISIGGWVGTSRADAIACIELAYDPHMNGISPTYVEHLSLRKSAAVREAILCLAPQRQHMSSVLSALPAHMLNILLDINNIDVCIKKKRLLI